MRNPIDMTNNELALGSVSREAILLSATFGTGKQENQGKIVLEPDATGQWFTIEVRRTRMIKRKLRGRVSFPTAMHLASKHDLGAEYKNIDEAEHLIRQMIQDRAAVQAMKLKYGSASTAKTGLIPA